ncbi:23S rRNA (uracil-5-)-methyltransferase RumA [Gluconacetobacter diazotrophicus PA1 5]|uniref:23S rRNA (Uracil-5-)-methyltransferase RumA n=2 Tax=Gluconacetobacter diazotrophicus TaxID=33996 RepID=A9HRW8_GLUDA|nr:class I SAM-dependent RNA methyltransferase [Gluconacetobacter diazotrophicus]ACI53045.1 23S rRNA (uracil-5-)-methyltransferase RumA [Gluconacetobacter diazotrophicus PA1 5]MBB2157188.1 class I SAM-dependent RNA methyltransferase [Gluconacetobacter diazotrophicus]TWB07716.1 23S rRNA (uracil1939-C5)-methyltransferase [Gluconacetobacter diazotrophicus]CAP56993.1 23S rRNA (uracil-5-)-methyltransferase RumA [Gluconacetobacter diazotrophicus PA1 5]
MTIEADIALLGTDGDGIARTAEGDRLFIPGALPGEHVLADRVDERTAHLTSILRPSPDRVTPPCPLFGTCGGCAIQHLSLAAALDWKAGLVVHALERAGFAAPAITGTVQSPPGSRRRIDLAVRRRPEGVCIGLHARRGDVVDLTACPVLEPALFALLPALRAVMQSLGALRRDGDALINMLDSGPDLLLATDGPLEAADRAKLASFARDHRIPRIAWRRAGTTDVPETAAQTASVRHELSGVATMPPPGAFLQPTREGEAAIIAAVLAGLPRRLVRKDTVIELYAGCGTLSFALGQHVRTLAFEGQPDAVATLRRATTGTRVVAEQRDLNRQPVMARQIADARAVVLDPPYTGAGAQMAEIVAGRPERIVYVSCNPQALGRDAAGLQAAGYRLDGVTIIDQFLWSTEVEAVCVFTAPPAPRRRTR